MPNLFKQAARLARSPFRSIILIEGPRPLLMPDVDANALKGATVSLALMWRLPLLQGLPGVGPELAHRLLIRFGSIERIVAADERALREVRGVGPQTAARIRRVLNE